MQHKRRNNFTRVIFFAFTLIVATLANLSCRGQLPLPHGWVSHTFKLTEHPEAFAGGQEAFENVKGRMALDRDVRVGFKMGANPQLSFNVTLTPGGSLRFAHGYEDQLFRSGKELSLTVKIKNEGFDTVLGRWDIQPMQVTRALEWTEAEVKLPEGVEGEFLLTFSLEGLQRPTAESAFFLAHPCIVAPDDGGKRKRVIWIAIDTLRADHLSCYGYERRTSPYIDAFVREGTLFERCISVSPWTFPSFASMFTGRYPSVAGALTNVRFLPHEENTLAEIISGYDFATLSIRNNAWVGPTANMQQGFDTCVGFPNERAKLSFHLAAEWLERHADEDCFVFLHLFDPHVPYEPPKEFRDRFDPDYKGRYKYAKEGYTGLRFGKNRLSKREKFHIEALYDEEILGCDYDTGQFLGYLKENRMYEDSLIIINSDHGEEFWEHGGYAHGHQLYDEVLRVPFIMRGPSIKEGLRVEQMVGCIDVFPTILEWLGCVVPDNINAISVFSTLNGEVDPESRMLLSEQLYWGTEQKSVSTDAYRYILHTIDSSEELYNVTDDPVMLVNVAPDRRATSRNFRYFLTEYAVNEGVGWHVRVYRTQRKDRLGAHYEGKIVAPSGFAETKSTRLERSDVFNVNGNTLTFSVSVPKDSNKAFDFRTNDENDNVELEIITDGGLDRDQWVFLGPEMIHADSTCFTMSIKDPMFGLGTPVFGAQGGKHHGFYLWGNSEALREQITPEIDDRTKAELRALGYLH